MTLYDNGMLSRPFKYANPSMQLMTPEQRPIPDACSPFNVTRGASRKLSKRMYGVELPLVASPSRIHQVPSTFSRNCAIIFSFSKSFRAQNDWLKLSLGGRRTIMPIPAISRKPNTCSSSRPAVSHHELIRMYSRREHIAIQKRSTRTNHQST